MDGMDGNLKKKLFCGKVFPISLSISILSILRLGFKFPF